jgi:hypothetical protein
MRITINDLISRDCTRERVEELFNGRESVTAHDIATAPMIPLRERARLLSYLLGPRDVTREVARRIARDALGNRKIPAPYKAWLDTGDESLRAAAWDAVWVAAWFGAEAAAVVAAWSSTVLVDAGVVAWVVADAAVWDVAWLGAVWDVAWLGADGRSVAGAVARSVARDKYIGWMAEWLDNHE